MKRLALASASLAVLVPGVAEAAAPSARHSKDYARAYRAVAKKFGARAPGRNIVRWGMLHRKATDQDVMASLAVLSRMLAPPPRPYTPTAAPTAATIATTTYTPTSYTSTPSSSYSSSGGGYSSVPGVPSGFAACVAMRESTNGAGSSNIYGIQGPGGSGSIEQQKAAFAQMYASRGTQPWSPYDGC